MFIEVIPFGGSIDNEWLTYFVRDELAQDIQVGCLVEVPFRKDVDYAIVTKINAPEIQEELKSIVRIITTTPLLSVYQIQTIFEISSYYFIHLHHVLSLFLSKTVVKYLEKKDFKALISKPQTTEKTEQKIRFYHHADNPSFFQILHENIEWKTAIIFPDDFSLNAYFKAFSLDTENELTIPDSLTDTNKYKAFAVVYNWEKNIIIWTRRLLYYNLSQYENIFYIEDSLHKTAMRFMHTYKHLDILRRITLHAHLKVTIFSTLPSIESMYLLHSGVYEKSKY